MLYDIKLLVHADIPTDDKLVYWYEIDKRSEGNLPLY